MEIPSPEEPIDRYYETTSKTLGQGYFAIVKIGINKETKEEVAIKMIQKKKVEKKNNLATEIKILKNVDHPNIVKLFAVFDTHETLFIVMEYMKGGELYEEIIRRKTFSEKEASYVMSQLFSGLAYIHKRGIVHRDLKLENLLLIKPGSLDIKMADFGLSKITGGDTLTTACGTPFYVAPDILLGTPYDSSVDMWAAGILLYILLSGRLPFAAESENELFRLIIECNLIWKSPQFDTVSDTAKNLIRRLIIADPTIRYSSEQALCHPFITEHNQSDLPLHESLAENLKNISALSKASVEKFLAKSSFSSSTSDENIFIEDDDD